MLSGFPFDSNSRRSRDPLEDIAQRHPELAQHLQSFPRRSQRAGDQDEGEFLRRFDRPFTGGRFERFGFPFDRDDFEREPQRYYEAYPEYFENIQNQQPQSPSHQQQQQPQQQQSSSQTSPTFEPHSPQFSQQYQPQHSQQYQPTYSQQSQETPQSQEPRYHSQISQGTQTDCGEPAKETESSAQEPKVESGQIRGRPIQQSNTCDLGQSSPDEAVNDRNQRSMSLPPENKRYTSSINIPMGGHQGQENAKPQSQSGGSGSTERVIPIHVEGRDDPIIPKTFSTTSAQPQPQPERIFTDSPRPQPERIFGQRPEHFTQFVNRDPHRFPGDWHNRFDSRPDFPEEDFGFVRAGSPSRFGGVKTQQQAHAAPPQYQQQQRQEAGTQGQAPPQPQKPQATQEQKPAQDETPQPPKPQPPKQPLGPIEQIQAIQKDVSDLIRKVEVFNGMPRDKNYLYLDEMLTRNLLKLDNVDTQGQDAIRQARKEAIKCIERTIGLLESRAAANAAGNGQKMEVEQPQSSQEGEKMETEPLQEPARMEDSPAPNQQQESETASFSQEEGNKNAEGHSKSGEVQHSKSSEIMGINQEQTKTKEKQPEIKTEEPKGEGDSTNAEVRQESAPKEQVANADIQGSELQDRIEDVKNSEVASEQEGKTEEGEVKEEKKEKKKIKKKVNKEDKEKKQ